MLNYQDLFINLFIYIIIPFIINEQEELFSLPASAQLPNLIKFKFGRSIKYSFKSFKYLILLLIKTVQMHYFLIQSISNVEDLFIINNIIYHTLHLKRRIPEINRPSFIIRFRIISFNRTYFDS